MNAGKKFQNQQHQQNLNLSAARDARNALPNPKGAVFHQSEVVSYWTTDYWAIDPDPANRPIDPIKLKRLVAAIKRDNKLPRNPITVDSNFKLTDGQHRYQAAVILKLPIYVTVDEKATLDDAIDTAANTDSWKLSDHLHRFTVQGRPEYLKLKAFLDEHPWMAVSTAATLCTFGSVTHSAVFTEEQPHNTFFKRFQAGMYQADDIEFAGRVARMVKDFDGIFKSWKHTHFLRALTHLASNSDYDHAQMMRKIDYQSTRLVRCATAEGYIALLDEIYNHKVQYQNRVLLTKLNSHDPKYRVDRRAKGLK